MRSPSPSPAAFSRPATGPPRPDHTAIIRESEQPEAAPRDQLQPKGSQS
jgi:hypothetical protein